MKTSAHSQVADFRVEVEARRLRFLNIIASVAFVLTIGYLISYASRGWWLPAAVNCAALVGYGVGLALARGSQTRLAPLVIIATGLCAVTSITVLSLGAASGNHFFLMVILPFSFVIIHPLDHRWRSVAAGTALLAFIGTETASVVWTPPFPINASESELWLMHLSSTVLSALFITGVLFLFNRDAERAQKALYAEHDRSEALLLNILPAPIANRLKQTTETIADAHTATVLFSDIVGFTKLSSVTPPHQLVDLLNLYFTAYDELADDFGVEKIKTIGDAYMAATGVPDEHIDPVYAMVQMARGMIEATRRINEQSGTQLEVRIGLNTGPVTAGVIGQKKFVYDLWGDAVNVASRMESSGLPGRIQVSASVEEALRGRVSFESRGQIDIKGKGAMAVFLVLP